MPMLQHLFVAEQFAQAQVAAVPPLPQAGQHFWVLPSQLAGNGKSLRRWIDWLRFSGVSFAGGVPALVLAWMARVPGLEAPVLLVLGLSVPVFWAFAGGVRRPRARPRASRPRLVLIGAMRRASEEDLRPIRVVVPSGG